MYTTTNVKYVNITINNVGRTFLLGLPRKQNGHPIECIKLLVFISPSKRGAQGLSRLRYGLLMMVKLAGPLMDVKHTNKAPN